MATYHEYQSTNILSSQSWTSFMFLVMKGFATPKNLETNFYNFPFMIIRPKIWSGSFPSMVALYRETSPQWLLISVNSQTIRLFWPLNQMSAVTSKTYDLSLLHKHWCVESIWIRQRNSKNCAILVAWRSLRVSFNKSFSEINLMQLTRQPSKS